MLIDKVFERMSKHAEKQKMGMIASHLGLVRATSLDGSPVTAMEVQFDMDVINRIVNEIKRKDCLLYTSPSPRDLSTSRMPSSA